MTFFAHIYKHQDIINISQSFVRSSHYCNIVLNFVVIENFKKLFLSQDTPSNFDCYIFKFQLLNNARMNISKEIARVVLFTCFITRSYYKLLSILEFRATIELRENKITLLRKRIIVRTYLQLRIVFITINNVVVNFINSYVYSSSNYTIICSC